MRGGGVEMGVARRVQAPNASLFRRPYSSTAAARNAAALAVAERPIAAERSVVTVEILYAIKWRAMCRAQQCTLAPQTRHVALRRMEGRPRQ